MAVLTSALFALPVFTGCTSDAGNNAKPDRTNPVSFLVSCDTNGWIVPCGCTTKQSGGLLRRGTMVQTLSQTGDVVVLDVGGAAAGVSDYHRVKFEAILQGELAMGLAAHNIGASEAKFGAKTIGEIESELNVPFVSANVFAADGQPIAQPMVTVEESGQRFAVIGVLDPSFRCGDLKVTDPKEAILNLIDNTTEPLDGIVVLAYLPREALLKLASQLPEVDVILGGPTGQTIAPTRKGATLVASTTNKGKFVTQLQFAPLAPQKWSGNITEVDDTLADHVAQIENLDDYHKVLGERDFEAALTGLSRQTGTIGSGHAFVGTASCNKCHVDDCTHFASTKHAIAWPTLEQSGSHVDPYCQQCHTTGYGRNDGFISIANSPLLFNVGCESCHGPSSVHAAEPKKRTPFAAKEVCLQCHDRENSPAFEYTTYWTKIIHGAKVVIDEEVQP